LAAAQGQTLMAKARCDHNTPDLLTWQPPKVAVGFGAEDVRGGSLDSRIARAVSLALKRSSKTREKVAEEMTDWLGRSVSKAMLDAYAAEERTTHRIPLDRFIALIEVTGCLDLIGLVAEPFDLVAVPGRYMAIIRLHQIEEHERDLAQLKAEVQAELRRPRG
jgi:hypothetical protein